MAYTPTNWSTGDTITASDMNKLENAVANSGGRVPFYVVTTTGFSGSAANGYQFFYLKKTGNTYNVAQGFASGGIAAVTLYVNGTFVWYAPCPIPTLDGYFLAISPFDGVSFSNVSGDISSPMYVSGVTQPLYIITGDFTFTVTKNN